MHPSRFLATPAALLLAAAPLFADGTATDANGPAEYVEVTTSRIPEEVEDVPASVTVITRQELQDRGATDLRTALFFAAGVEISPGGDAGPASSVPEFWGLRELDAFLLVVDGVPWGGAFNPSLSTIDLADVERIEVLRGAAPVMYGATSFVGVIQILRRPAGEGETTATARTASFGGAGLGASTPLPRLGTFASTLAGDAGRVNFRDDRTGVDRGHLLWRGGTPLGKGRLRLDADAIWIGQDPASPQPRVGREITNLAPLTRTTTPTTPTSTSAGSSSWPDTTTPSPARREPSRRPCRSPVPTRGSSAASSPTCRTRTPTRTGSARPSRRPTSTSTRTATSTSRAR